ncbi:outer membrane beta-barrel family protein [Candidatus Palauibacter sp.]|uniref:outer membrane beta-barrel family protein n=1 Tax=Candidatus Palauibacter sp. TaxID=3101350 RepID=UPI003B5C6B62
MRRSSVLAPLAVLALIGAARPDPALAQSDFAVSGVVADTAGAGLNGAMVVALAKPDSVLTRFTTTNGEGVFVLGDLRPGEYVLQVTLIGHGTIRQDLTVTGENVNVGTIQLEVMAVEMDPLVITLDHVPFLNRRDTLGYNAGAFRTRPNATVEDLLRQLPGVEVETDGSIKAQGEDVENVLVDGREFFGSDPKIATRNLPAEAVDRVQIYDKESDMAEFTGIADGEEERTINLELKEEARTGYFGRMAGGLGADMQGTPVSPGFGESVAARLPGDPGAATGNGLPYAGALTLNRFSPTTQLALIGNANNVNQAGFGWGDVISFTGGMDILRGGGGDFVGGRDDGLTETVALGLNASRDFGEDNWVRTSYFLSTVDNFQNETRRQEQLLGTDVSSLVDRATRTETDNASHRVNLNSQFTFSEGHDLRVRGNLNARNSLMDRVDFQDTRSGTGQFQTTASTDYEVDNDNLGGNARLTWRKRLNDNGQSLVAEARVNLSDSDRFTDLASIVEGTQRNSRAQSGDLFQEQTNTGQTLTHSVRLSMTQPLAERAVLEIYGERSATAEDEDQSVFDIGPTGRTPNDLLSSGFERSYSYLRGGFRFNRTSEAGRLVLGLRVQNSDLHGTILDRDETIANGYTHILPNADYRLQVSDTRTVNFRYSTSTREPRMTDLQPFVDNRDPLRIRMGNPDLRPEYTHRLRGEYRFFDTFSFVNLFTFANVSYTTNDISQSRTVTERGVQTISPVNLGQSLSASGGASFGTPLRWMGAQLDLNYRLSYSSSTEFVNQVENRNQTLGHTVGIELENRAKEDLDARAGAKLSFSNVTYSLNEELNEDYLNSTLYASADVYLGSWTLGTEFNYRLYDQDLFGPGRNVALWEASIRRMILNDRAEIRLVAFDMLGQNQGVTYTNSPGFIQERRVESLTQYVMLNFTWYLGSRSTSGGGVGGRSGGRFRR